MDEPNAPRGFESRGVTWPRVRLAQQLGRAAIASAAGGLIGGSVARAFELYRVGTVASSVLSLGAVALLVTSFILWFRRASWPGAVTIDSQGVAVRRGVALRRIERSQITSAYPVMRYLRGEVVATVELELEGGDLVTFEVPREDAAREIVDDLGFGPGKKRIHIALGSPARRLYHLLMAVAAYYVGSIVALPLVAFTGFERNASAVSALAHVVSTAAMVVAYMFLRSVVRAPEVTIGDDGVSYRAGRKERFLPGTAITGVEQPSAALPLLLCSTRENPIAIHGTALDLERRSTVARLAYERFVGPAGPADQAGAQFARGGRTLPAWREHLRTRLGDVGYREAASPVDVAALVLRSVRSTSEERAGAALALRVAGRAEDRIRVAASAVVDEDLRVALEAIADAGDDVVIERALRKLS